MFAVTRRLPFHTLFAAIAVAGALLATGLPGVALAQERIGVADQQRVRNMVVSAKSNFDAVRKQRIGKRMNRLQQERMQLTSQYDQLQREQDILPQNVIRQRAQYIKSRNDSITAELNRLNLARQVFGSVKEDNFRIREAFSEIAKKYGFKVIYNSNAIAWNEGGTIDVTEDVIDFAFIGF